MKCLSLPFNIYVYSLELWLWDPNYNYFDLYESIFKNLPVIHLISKNIHFLVVSFFWSASFFFWGGSSIFLNISESLITNLFHELFVFSGVICSLCSSQSFVWPSGFSQLSGVLRFVHLMLWIIDSINEYSIRAGFSLPGIVCVKNSGWISSCREK